MGSFYVQPTPRTSTFTVAASNSNDKRFADYICTGTNDHTTINNAISALPSGGGKVVLLDGTYTLGGSITIAKSNVILEGQGTNTQIKLANAINTDVITLGDGTNSYTDIEVRNLFIDGNMANQTTGTHGIDILAHASRCIVDSCHIKNTFKANININDATAQYCIISNNYCDTTSSSSTFANIEGGGDYIKILNNTCINGRYDCLDLYNGSYHLVEGNTCILSVAPNASAGGLEETSNYSIVRNNHFVITVNCTYGIFIGNQWIDCIGNDILITTGNTTAVKGISVQGDDTKILENTIKFTTTGIAHIGIYMPGYNRVLVNDNHVEAADNTSGSIGLSIGITDGIICDNTIYKFEFGISGHAQLKTTIDGNTFSQNTNGIDLTGSINTTVSNNVFDSLTGGAGVGILASGSGNNQITTCTIAGNQLFGYGHEGMKLIGAEYCTISNNVIDSVGLTTNNTYPAISLTDNGAIFCTYNTVNGNVIVSTSFTNRPSYGIRENSASDNHNIVTSNIALNAATAQISLQGAQSIQANNITA